MNDNDYSIKFPRRVFVRKGMTGLGKILLSLMADVQINGKERLPRKGPVILAGNHVAVMEAVMMAVFNPGLVEFIGNGDIPFDPNYAFIAHAYGLVPVNRGNLDLKGLGMGLDVLAQDGILGIFPEGGTWNPAQMQAQLGVAWLSYKAHAPVIPVGFGGIRNALRDILRFKHPKLIMNVGDMRQPVQLNDNSFSMKENLQIAANQIMEDINALVPEVDLASFQKRIYENYDLEIDIFPPTDILSLPEDLQVKNRSAYAHFLFNPTMIDVLYRNLSLPIKPIKHLDYHSDLNPLLNAWHAILDYLEVNPGFFTYRFGIEEGLAVKESLKELCRLGEWAQESGYKIAINPVCQYKNANTGARVVERGGCFPDSM
ncbi:MAG: lysophospholipid acyltransferase family protein [Brevefilum sp.]|nr:lysophospholipid acyltransferase family protein [Brevefilum sp.]MDT8380943.1 lysophospholipid acyltransferase family protein [Brevefilum sp.]